MKWLYCLLLVGLSLPLVSCVHETKGTQLTPQITYLQSQLSPKDLTQKTGNFLELYKGYNLSVRDLQEGLLVSDWVEDSLNQRHRVTVRINQDLKGSMLTVHFEIQQTSDGQHWMEVPSNGLLESQMITELKEQLRHSATFHQ